MEIPYKRVRGCQSKDLCNSEGLKSGYLYFGMMSSCKPCLQGTKELWRSKRLSLKFTKIVLASSCMWMLTSLRERTAVANCRTGTYFAEVEAVERK